MISKAMLGLGFAAIASLLSIGVFSAQPTAFADGDDDDLGFLEIVKKKFWTKNDKLNIYIKTDDRIPKFSGKAFGFAAINSVYDNGTPDNPDDDVPENAIGITWHRCAADSLEQRNINEKRLCKNITGGETIGVLEALAPVLGLPEDIQNTQHDSGRGHPHILDLKSVVADSPCSELEDGEGNPIESPLEVDVVRTLNLDNEPDREMNNISPSRSLSEYTMIAFGKHLFLKNIPIDESNSQASDVAAFASYTITPVADGNLITNLCLTDVTVFPVA